MRFIDLRLKIRRFFRKNRKILIIGFIAWAIIFLLNQIVMKMPKEYKAETTYEPHTSVMNDSSKTPIALRNSIEKIIEEYVGYLNDGNFQAAFNMLSEDCRKYGFSDNIQNYMSHVYTKMPTPKKYAVQDYSNINYGNKNMYIYEVRYFDDFLATGLTNSDYQYTQENITFYDSEEGVQMNVGNYIYHADIKNISENEYLKIDIIDKVVNYSIETYEVKFTNRSSKYTVVIADRQESEEVVLTLPNEVRNPTTIQEIVLLPNESITLKFTFPKFVDDGESSQTLSFSAIRVMEKYSGTQWVDEATIQSEIDNAISKFRMDVSVME